MDRDLNGHVSKNKLSGRDQALHESVLKNIKRKKNKPGVPTVAQWLRT